MASKFGNSKAKNFWSPYLDWAAQLSEYSPWRSPHLPQTDTRTIDPGIYEPIFVRSKVEDFFYQVDHDRDTGLFYESMEVALNDTATFRPPKTPIEAFLYSKVGGKRERDYYDVLHVGSPVAIEKGVAAGFRIKIPQDFVGPTVAIGIIDDGIGYLNNRFSRFSKCIPTKTRFLAFWHQSLAKKKKKSDKNVQLGRVIFQNEIERQRTSAIRIGEQHLYRQSNNQTYPDGITRTVEQAASHGTHILDLATGESPAGPNHFSDVPIIGVQLPPDSIDDTSGVRLETHLLQGLRWMIAVARVGKVENLVVNASLGVHAGPKDGYKFIEQQMAWEIDKAAMSTGALNGVNVEIVLPYGNEYESRQVAVLEPVEGKDAGVGLRLQPDDLTPSYVEIRPIPNNGYVADLGALCVGLILPDGTALAPVEIKAGHYRDIENEGEIVGRVYHVSPKPAAINGQDVQPFIALAFAPTSPLAPNAGDVPPAGDMWRTKAPSGLWTIVLNLESEPAGRFSVQIQRDDSAVGYARRGRQAYFDDNYAHEWDAKDRDYTELHRRKSAVYHAGTNGAYTTSKKRGMHTVGAALVREGPPGLTLVEPARYASEGADWSGEEPSGSALSETGRATWGLLASGSISGSAARFVGSSTAAASYSRDLVLKHLKKAPLRKILNPPNPSQLGNSTIIENPAVRDRKL